MSILYDKSTSLYPLIETYYGKPKEFEEIEKLLDILIDKFKILYDDSGNLTDQKLKLGDVNEMPEVKRIEKIFKDYFKIKEFHLTFYIPVLFLYANNAFCLPTYLTYFTRDKNNKKLADAKKLFVNVNVDIGLAINGKLDSKELLALILHEIGHAFDASIAMYLSSWLELASITLSIPLRSKIINAIVLLYQQTKKFGRFSIGLQQTWTKIASDYPDVYNYLNTFNKILFTGLDTLSMILPFVRPINEIKEIFSKLTTEPFPAMVKILRRFVTPKGLLGYGGEKFADSFASSYGYGQYLSSAMVKLDTKRMNIIDAYSEDNDIKILRFGIDFARTTVGLATSLADPHPRHVTRINNQINKLKRDLNDPNLSLRIKKELMEQIESMEDTLKQNYTSTDVAKQGKVLSFIYNFILINVFKGKMDPREFIHGKRREM